MKQKLLTVSQVAKELGLNNAAIYKILFGICGCPSSLIKTEKEKAARLSVKKGYCVVNKKETLLTKEFIDEAKSIAKWYGIIRGKYLFESYCKGEQTGKDKQWAQLNVQSIDIWTVSTKPKQEKHGTRTK